MFERLSSFYNVFRAGQSVADAVKLKNKQLILNALVALFSGVIGIGKIYGYDFHLTPDDITHIAGVGAVLIGLFNAGATVASTDKIGILPARQPDPAEQPAVPDVVTTTSPEPVLSESAPHQYRSIWDNPGG
ncbi:hypothetical protein ACO0LB_09930 [Undibacterium sp. SXout7W]|uniref:hypothetical protein n=1 Tax=Undibacterium sp. SXout7W TaxID=3413049 RepID=UPI003BF1BAF8